MYASKKFINRLLFISALCIVSAIIVGICNSSRLPALSELPHKYIRQVNAALDNAGENRYELIRALNATEPDRLDSLCYMISRFTPNDLATIDSRTLLDSVNCVYEVREKVPWKLPTDSQLFRDYVLPQRIMCENLENSRRELMRITLPIVRGCSTSGEAFLRILRSHMAYEKKRELTLGPATPSDYTPISGMRYGQGCRNASLVEVAMARSVGIPARVVQIPNWISQDGMHAAAEYYDTRDGKWHTVDQCENTGEPEASIKNVARCCGVPGAYVIPPYTPGGDLLGKRQYDQMENVAARIFPVSVLRVIVKDGNSIASSAHLVAYIWTNDQWLAVARSSCNEHGEGQLALGSNAGYAPYMISAAANNNANFCFVSLRAATRQQLVIDLSANMETQVINVTRKLHP